MQTLLINPSRRRRSKKRRSARRGKRRMSALQRKYFGGGRKRRAHTVTVLRANPARRHRRRASKRRSFRRNPSRAMRLPSLGVNVGNLQRAIGTAFQGAAGAVAVDVAMGQAAGFLPLTLSARYSETGGINPGYYATKAALAFALGALGARLLPGRAKAWAAQGVVGSLTVQGYEILRNVLPPSVTLGAYLNPARVVAGGMGRARGLRGGRMGAYLTRQTIGKTRETNGALSASGDIRIGEGLVQ